jgi:hypothetical protein
LPLAYPFDFGKQGIGHRVATKDQSGNDLDTVTTQDLERVAKRYILFASFLFLVCSFASVIMQGNRVKKKNEL